MQAQTYEQALESLRITVLEGNPTSSTLVDYLRYAPRIGIMCVTTLGEDTKIDLLCISQSPNTGTKRNKTRSNHSVYSICHAQWFAPCCDDSAVFSVDQDDNTWIDYRHLNALSIKGITGFITARFARNGLKVDDVAVYFDIFTISNIIRASSLCDFIHDLPSTDPRGVEAEKLLSSWLRRRCTKTIKNLCWDFDFNEEEQSFCEMLRKADLELAHAAGHKDVTLEDIRERSELDGAQLYAVLNSTVIGATECANKRPREVLGWLKQHINIL